MSCGDGLYGTLDGGLPVNRDRELSVATKHAVAHEQTTYTVAYLTDEHEG